MPHKIEGTGIERSSGLEIAITIFLWISLAVAIIGTIGIFLQILTTVLASFFTFWAMFAWILLVPYFLILYIIFGIISITGIALFLTQFSRISKKQYHRVNKPLLLVAGILCLFGFGAGAPMIVLAILLFVY